MQPQNSTPVITVSGAIIIAAAIIGIALIWINKPISSPKTDDTSLPTNTITVSPITSDDHILGNPNAAIRIIEYSDSSCPFCKVFNNTMVKIMDKYGPDGKVAWIYRSYPLNKPDANGNILHPKAGREAEAMECASSLGDNKTFWAYQKRLYEVTPSVTSENPTGLDDKELPAIAKYVGLDESAFTECLDSGEMSSIVEAQAKSGDEAGVIGTPTSFILLGDSISSASASYLSNALVQYRIPPELLFVSPDKKTIFMSGAMPEMLISGLINTLLGN